MKLGVLRIYLVRQAIDSKWGQLRPHFASNKAAGAALAIAAIIIFTACGSTSLKQTPTPTPTVILYAKAPSPTPRTGDNLQTEEIRGSALIDSTATYPAGAGVCRDRWYLEFKFAVDATGTVRGEGEANQQDPVVCPFQIDPSLSWKRVQYRVLGSKSEKSLTLRFALFEWDGGADLAGFSSMFGHPAPPTGGPPITILCNESGAIAENNAVAWEFSSGTPPSVYAATGSIQIASCP